MNVNRKVKILAISSLCVVMMVSATGCGTKTTHTDSEISAANGYVMSESEYEAAVSYSDGTDVYAETNYSVRDGTQSTNIVQDTDNKIIYTAYISMETKEYDNCLELIDNLVSIYGGYYSSKYTSTDSGDYRYSSLAVRCPTDKYESFIYELSATATVKSQREDASDVTDQYTDVETRLETAKKKLTRLQELLDEAEEMADIIEIETAISDAELEIDELQGSLNYLDSQVTYSTINIDIQEVKDIVVEDVNQSFGEKISTAFSQGLKETKEWFEDFSIWLAEYWIFVVIAIVLILLAIFIPVGCVKSSRKKKAKRSESIMIKNEKKEPEIPDEPEIEQEAEPEKKEPEYDSVFEDEEFTFDDFVEKDIKNTENDVKKSDL